MGNTITSRCVSPCAETSRGSVHITGQLPVVSRDGPDADGIHGGISAIGSTAGAASRCAQVCYGRAGSAMEVRLEEDHDEGMTGSGLGKVLPPSVLELGAAEPTIHMDQPPVAYATGGLGGFGSASGSSQSPGSSPTSPGRRSVSIGRVSSINPRLSECSISSPPGEPQGFMLSGRSRSDLTLGRFHVRLEQTGSPLGLVLAKGLGCLTVQNVSEFPSALAKLWNSAHPEKAIRAGDRIVAINRKRGTCEELLELVKQQGDLELTVQRDFAETASLLSRSSSADTLREIPEGLSSVGIGRLRHSDSVEAPPGTLEECYQLGDEIGRGGFGRVHKATSIESGEVFAVKSTPLHKLKIGLNYEAEFKILRRLDHMNIVRLYAVFQDDREMHFVMEYCVGGSLADRIRAVDHGSKRMQGRGGLPATLMEACVTQMLCGIAYLHHHRFVHRDIKPANYLFEKQGSDSLKLVDFGLAVRCPSGGQGLKGVVGTLFYVAPEMMKGAYCEKVDLWSIGITAFETTLGTLPYLVMEEEDQMAKQIVEGKLEWNELGWRSVNTQYRALVEALLTKSPEERPSAVSLFNENQWLQKQVRSMTNGAAASSIAVAPRWGLRSINLGSVRRSLGGMT